jgi:hypothetical protein
MSKQHLISSRFIIAKVHSDFRPSEKGWGADAIEWIGEALGIMGLMYSLTTTSCKAQVKDYRLKLPCPIEVLHGVLYECKKLKLINGQVRVDILSKKLGDAVEHPLHSYQMNPNFLHFSFPEGKVELFYDAFPVDEKGLPMIPKDHKVTQALSWFIMRQLLMRGMVHPTITFQEADARWENYYVRAQNSMKQMTVAQREQFSRNWLSVMPTVPREDDFYTEVSDVQYKGPNSDINDFLGTTIQ